MDHLETAKYLLSNSYPSLKDPKLLLAATRHVYDALDEGITKRLEQERKKKSIPAYGDTFNGRLTVLRMHLAKRLGITPIDFMLIGEIQEILVKHDQAPVAFRRKTSFIIADNDYNLSTLTPQKVKTYITRATLLLSRL